MRKEKYFVLVPQASIYEVVKHTHHLSFFFSVFQEPKAYSKGGL
jgi:hypothetical protein